MFFEKWYPIADITSKRTNKCDYEFIQLNLAIHGVARAKPELKL